MVTFVYDKATIFLDRLVNSINSQTDIDFSVIVFNDNVDNPEIYFSKLNFNYTIVKLKSNNPQDLRYEGLDFLKTTKFDYFVFQDCDDELDNRRVEVVKKLSINYQLITNDLTIIDNESNIIDNYIWRNKINNRIFDYKDIENYNFVGFGNTSLSYELLRYLPKIPSIDIIAVDWYLFYSILKKSKTIGFFTSKTTTLYRQHFENTIGIAKDEMLSKILKVRDDFHSLIGVNINKTITDFEIPLKIKNQYPFWWELKQKE